MRNLLPLILGLYLLSFSVSAEPLTAEAEHSGAAKSTAALVKTPAIGLVGKKVPARTGQKSFELPNAAAQRLDNWYREHKDMLQVKAWNDPSVVSDDQVRGIKQSLGSYLIADDIKKFGQSIKIGVSNAGLIRIEFPKTGQSFSYTPGPASKYER